MSDLDLPSTGRDTKILISLDGVLKRIEDEVVAFTANPTWTEITTKPLGKPQVYIDIEPDGWEGTVEVAPSSHQLDELIDLVEAALRGRLPGLLVIQDTTYYRDLTSKTYAYPDVKFTAYERRVRRGEATTIQLTWKTGLGRLAA